MYTEKKLHNQLSQRIIIIVMIIVIISCSAFVYVFRQSYKHNERMLADQCEQISSSQRDNIISTLESEMSKVMVEAMNYRATIFSNGLDIPRDSVVIYKAFEQLLDATPKVSGVVAGFEDEIFPEYTKSMGFVPLVRRTDSCYLHMQVGEKRDARHTLDWYAYHRDHDSHEGLWSEPFLSDNGVPITSYSLPLRDKNDKFVGVIALDINLNDLATSVDQFKPYPSSSLAIVDNKYRFIAHPNREYILNWTLPQALKRIGCSPEGFPFEKFNNREKGFTTILMGNDPTFIFFGPVPQTRWMVMLYIPHSVVYDQLSELRNEMLIVAGIALVITILASGGIIWTFLKRPRRKRRRGYYSDDDEMYDDDAYMKVE